MRTSKRVRIKIFDSHVIAYPAESLINVTSQLSSAELAWISTIPKYRPNCLK